MGITREVSTAIRKLSFIFGLACLGACSATDKPSMDDDRETNCMPDSDCGPGESCDASECVPVDAPPDSEQVTEADLVELIEESTVADIAVILGGRTAFDLRTARVTWIRIDCSDCFCLKVAERDDCDALGGRGCSQS